MFSCGFVPFPYGVLGQVWCLIVSIPDLCLLPYFGYDLSDTHNGLSFYSFLYLNLYLLGGDIYIDKLGIFHANQTSICLDPRQK